MAAEAVLEIDLNQNEYLKKFDNDGAAYHLRVYARGLRNFNSRWTTVFVLFRFVGIVGVVYPGWVSTNNQVGENIN